jgi:hypothetical protein
VNLNHPYARRISALAIGLALAGTAACGGGSDGSSAPTDTSKSAFCKVLKGLDLSDPKSGAKKLADIGTPKGIPGDARDGFEVMIDKADQDKISDKDKEKVSAFLSYVSATCGV